MTRLYVSGPVTGIEDGNLAAFESVQKELEAAGYLTDKPHDLVDREDSHETAMLLCVNELTGRTQKPGIRHPVPRYDGVALIEGWEQSEGAKLEKAVAEACGMPCKTVDEWLEVAR